MMSFPLLVFFVLFITTPLCFFVSSQSLDYNIIQPIFDNQGIIQVAWSDIPKNTNPSPQTSDWISMWCAPFAAAYVQYFNVSSTQQQNSYGSVTFTNIINARHPYYFAYYRGNVSLAQTELVYPISHVPLQIRLSPVLQEEPQQQKQQQKQQKKKNNKIVRRKFTAKKNQDQYQDPPSGFTSMIFSWTSDRVSSDACVMISQNSDMSSSQSYSVSKFGFTSTYNSSELNQLVQLPPIQPRTTPFNNIQFKGLRCGWLPSPNRSQPGNKPACWSDVTAVEQFVDPGIFLSVRVDYLYPNTQYFYQVGECQNELLSKTRGFWTKPSATGTNSDDYSSSSSVSVLFFGDVGIGPIQSGFEGGALHNDIRMLASEGQAGAQFVFKSMIDHINSVNNNNNIKNKNYFKNKYDQQPFSLAILNGDVSYSRGWPFISESFHNWTSNFGIFDQVPQVMSFGNHDSDFMSMPFKLARSGDSGGECGLEIARRFLPNKPDFLEKPYYSLQHGPILFVALSSENKCEPQVEFLKSIGKSIDRSVTPWLVVFIHRPLFSLGTPDNTPFKLHLQEKFADIFTNVGVDVVVQSHDHEYTRYCGISSGACSKSWGFRDIYEKFDNVAVAPSQTSNCYLSSSFSSSSSNECRVICNKNANCTGIQYNKQSQECILLKCQNFTIGVNLIEYLGTQIFWLKERIYGETGPQMIVDGAGGAQFSHSTNTDSRVVFSSVDKFGYSTIFANQTTFEWRHYNAPGDQVLADDLILVKNN